MSWVRNNSHRLRLTLAGAALTGLVGIGAAMAEPAIIVKSTADQYKVGNKVDDEATITLAEGESVSVLTRKGSRTMKGPGSFVVGASPKSNRSRFTNLKRRGASTRTVAGATRGSSPEGVERPSKPKIFYIDVARSDRVCLINTAEVDLWRPYTDKPASYLINGPDLEQPVTAAFDARKSLALGENAPLTLTGGATYTIIGGEPGHGPAMTIATVTIIDLGRDYERADELAEALFENGCMTQFEMMGDRLLPDG